MVQVCVLPVRHSADKSPGPSIKEGVERLVLSRVQAGLSMTHPESSFLEDSFNGAGTITAGGRDLLEKP